jgi:hypothetical protein
MCSRGLDRGVRFGRSPKLTHISARQRCDGWKPARRKRTGPGPHVDPTTIGRFAMIAVGTGSGRVVVDHRPCLFPVSRLATSHSPAATNSSNICRSNTSLIASSRMGTSPTELRPTSPRTRLSYWDARKPASHLASSHSSHSSQYVGYKSMKNLLRVSMRPGGLGGTGTSWMIAPWARPHCCPRPIPFPT